MLTKPRDPSKMLQASVARRKRRFSPLMLAGISVPVVLALIAGAVFVLPRLGTHAAGVNPNCTLIVPANPLSAQGLATPYQLYAPDAAQNGPCNEANPNQSAFVQATIFTPATGNFAVYSPLVVDKGTQPAIAPVVPNIPPGSIVGIWFGFNGTNLTLQGSGGRFNNSLRQGACINGLQGSVFGQFAYCNAIQFFRAVNGAMAAGNVTIPALGTAKDGLPCPTTRDFSVVDQDQSDNVQTTYLANANGQTAQNTAANAAQLQGATEIANPSDNALMSEFMYPALGCQAFMAPDLANNNTPTFSFALDELSAAANQQAPVALVPLNDPMTLDNNNPNLLKTDLYRIGADQPPAFSNAGASGTTYCQNLFLPQADTGITRFAQDSNLFLNATSPAPATGNNLATFLANRLNASFTNLGCGNLLNIQNPVTLVNDGNGVTIGYTLVLPNGQTMSFGQQAAAAPTPTAAAGNGGAGGTTAATPTPAPTNGGAGAATPTPTPTDGGAGAGSAVTPTPSTTTGGTGTNP